MKSQFYRNQHTRLHGGLKYRTWLTLIYLLIFTGFGLLAIVYRHSLDQVYFVSPIAMNPERVYAEDIDIKIDSPEKAEIAEYIREVFGKDANKAFKVLSCENAKLNPDAVNTAGNVPAGSRDIGVFQINEYWQKVQGRFLFNWKINVQIAKQIFDDNGSFERWSCGRRMGI